MCDQEVHLGLAETLEKNTSLGQQLKKAKRDLRANAASLHLEKKERRKAEVAAASNVAPATKRQLVKLDRENKRVKVQVAAAEKAAKKAAATVSNYAMEVGTLR